MGKNALFDRENLAKGVKKKFFQMSRYLYTEQEFFCNIYA